MSEDIDFEQLVELLDKAISSDDPKVTKALKKFLFIAALSTNDDDQSDSEGPFTRMVRTIDSLQSRLATLEAQVHAQQNKTYPNYNPPYPGYPGGTQIWCDGSSSSGTITNATIPQWSRNTTPGSWHNVNTSTVNFDSLSFGDPTRSYTKEEMEGLTEKTLRDLDRDLDNLS